MPNGTNWILSVSGSNVWLPNGEQMSYSACHIGPNIPLVPVVPMVAPRWLDHKKEFTPLLVLCNESVAMCIGAVKQAGRQTYRQTDRQTDGRLAGQCLDRTGRMARSAWGKP
jgi:hypothetical protein